LIANKPEIVTQKRIINMFKDPNLMGYEYLGDLKDEENNSNIEKELLKKFLKDKYDSTLIKKAISELEKVTTDQNKKLYNINKEMYSLLRYGVKIKEDVGDNSETVWLINWKEPLKNDFYIAEEVTIKGENTKRPDIVLYVNGIALAVIELKRSSVSVAQGIRQNLDNQKSEFIKNFFATIQLVMAGSDSEGLRYGVIDTPEKYYLTWKEDTPIEQPLDSHLYAMCQKERLLEIIHDFIVFDSGIKKICRHNQYFGAKKTQESLNKEEGGILWHTQGSGKSLLMIWLAKWIRENRKDKPRVLIITDRKELDDQIEKFFMNVDETIIRTTSGKDLVEKLDKNDPWLMCSLIHKFRENNKSEHDDYLKELFDNLDNDFKAKGNLHVFIDECHRTQSGVLHDAMKKLVPNAIVIGFTGTPLLKTNKTTSLEKFGKYIHTYKYDEAVEDKVVLDLRYESRNIEQNLSSPEKIDQWFEATTKGLTEFGKTELKKSWGTLQKVFSSKNRLEKIVGDVIFDMKMEDRLVKGNGNAILVAGSIYQACRYYDIFQKNSFKKCAIITSYDGNISSIKGETVGVEEETEAEYMHDTYNKMLEDYDKIGIGNKDPETFERTVKDLFINEPKQMKLLIVVNKLLTGFDAPSATYLYIDKTMSDHGLFQAICRVNRLDGEDKEYGYIIDYKDLFKSIEGSVIDYTTDAFDGFDQKDVDGLLKNRIESGKQRLDETLEMIQTLCEPVKPPKGLPNYYEYFCGSSNELDNTEKLKESSQQRFMYYKITSSVIRAYANLSSYMEEAGYSKDETEKIKSKVKDYEGIKKAIMLRSGEYVDLKRFEPEMRHLIDNYIDAEESQKISVFEDSTLVELIVKSGIAGVVKNLPKRVRENKELVSEVVQSNIRKLITEEKSTDPKFFDKMSTLLDEIILDMKKGALEYEAYLKKLEALSKKLTDRFTDSDHPKSINTKAKLALYNNLDEKEDLALKIDETILRNKPDRWKGDKIKEKRLEIAVRETLAREGIYDEELVKKIMDLAREQQEY